MTYRPPIHMQGLLRFWWHVSLYLAAEARQKLGLTVTGSKPFLCRIEHRDLTRLLALLEPVVRRMFLLLAAERGALAPKARAVSPGVSSLAGQARRKIPPGPARKAAPRFRLTEGRSSAGAPRQTPIRYRTGPGIRFLDQDYPVDLSDYPALAGDLLPSGALVRRLAALSHALDNPEHYITAMRRRLKDADWPVSCMSPPAFRARWLLPSLRESAGKLQDGIGYAIRPDTS